MIKENKMEPLFNMQEMIECRTCPELKDQFGNFVWCSLLGRFVDWEYWHGTCADDCPKCKRTVKLNDEFRSG